MRILHVLNELKFSGAEIMYVGAASIFQKLGCELFVVNTTETLGTYTFAFKQKGYTVFHEPYPLRRREVKARWLWCKRMISLIKDERIDIVHIHASRLRFDMSYCAWKANVRSVYTFHNVFTTNRLWLRLYGTVQRMIAKNIFGCKFQTISDSVYNNEKNFWHNNTTLIYNWYNDLRFYPATIGEKEKIRTDLGISMDCLVLISVGGCSPIKRHSDIIKALPILLEVYPNLVYLHLGEGKSITAEFELAKSLRVVNNIRFLGNQEDVRKYLIASDIYVMPSKFEGISLTTIEAMACNIPSVLYNVPGLRDFNKEKECALIIPEDYKILAKKILDLYQNKSMQEELTINAKIFVDMNFNMNRNALKILELYK